MRPLFALWGSVGLFTLALSAAVVLLVDQQEKSATADASAQAMRTVAAAEASVNRALIGIDLMLLHSARTVMPGLVGGRTGGSTGASTPAAALDRARQADLRMAELAAASLQADELALIDDMGRVLAQSADRRALDTPLDAGFLRRAFDSTVPQLLVSDPTMSFARSEVVLFLARRVDLPDGARVVAVAQVSADLLAGLLLPAEAEGVSLTLERATGERLLSVPRRDQDADFVAARPLAELGWQFAQAG